MANVSVHPPLETCFSAHIETLTGYVTAYVYEEQAQEAGGTLLARPHFSLRLYDVVSVAAPPWGVAAQTAARDHRHNASGLKNNSVDSQHIVSGAVDTSELAVTALSAAKIASNAVTAAKIATGAVGSDEIAGLAVTQSKLASGAVSAGKIADGAVTTVKISDGAITQDKLSVTFEVGGSEIADQSIDCAHLTTALKILLGIDGAC